MARPSTADWAGIEAEWLAGSLSLKEIARQFGVTPGAIYKRAQRYDWDPRPESPMEFVQEFVTPCGQTPELWTNHSTNPPADPRAIALQSFARVMQLLRQHRGRLGWLSQELDQLMVEAEADRSGDRPMNAVEREAHAKFLLNVASLIERLNDMERAAFGLSPADMPSEADGFDSDQLAAIEGVVRKALGSGR